MTTSPLTSEDVPEFLRRKPSSFRILFDRFMSGLTLMAGFGTVLVLLLILYFTFQRGIGRLLFDENGDFSLAAWYSLTPAAGIDGGGFANAMLGTIILVTVATLIAFPLGVVAGVFLSEFPNTWFSSIIRFSVKVLTGVPSIISGVFAYGILVVTFGGYSALAGGVALSVLELPTIILTTEEAMRLVPTEVRAAAFSLGANRAQTTLRVIFPAALPVILTGTTIAIARGAGETAPLIFTAAFSFFWPTAQVATQPIASVAVMIYNFALVPYENQVELAWAASLVLVLIVLTASVSFRLLVKPKI